MFAFREGREAGEVTSGVSVRAYDQGFVTSAGEISWGGAGGKTP